MLKQNELVSASKDLGFTFEESDTQDWGIINADGSRVSEFVHYFNKNYKKKMDTFKFFMFELIIASFNDAILEKKTQNIEILFKNLVLKYKKEKIFEPIFSYWITIKNKHDYPVGYYLEKIIQE